MPNAKKEGFIYLPKLLGVIFKWARRVRVTDKVRLKPVSSSKETSWKIEISLVASLDMIHSSKRKIKALIRMRR